MIETAIIATVLTTGFMVVRQHWRVIRHAWRNAHWYEKCVLCLVLLPIPGPVDEIIGILLVRRIVRRVQQA